MLFVIRQMAARNGPRLLTGVVALVVGLGLFAATLLASTAVMEALRPRSAPAAERSAGYVAAGAVSRTDRAIGVLQEQLRQDPTLQRSQTALGLLYLQKVREVGDPGYYARAEGLLRQALEQAPNDSDTLIGLGSLALARHDFLGGLEWGQRAIAANPAKAAAYGVVGDALVELGRYDEAVATIQRMVDLRPDQASYARVSYLRELHGDAVGAIAAMSQAVDAGPPGTEGTEWTRVQLGHLHFNSGDLEGAEAAYRQALALYPSYVHAIGALARVAAARGDYDRSIRLYREATASQPIPELVIGLADVYHAAGRADDAARQEALVRAIQQLHAANGVDTDLEMALFDADRGVDLERALARARDRAATSRGIHVADAYAWALFRSGDCASADRYAREALRLGTRDSLLLFHAGQIAACVGDAERGRQLLSDALAQNPHFSLRYAPVARRLLESDLAHVSGRLP